MSPNEWHPLGGGGGIPSDMVTTDVINDRAHKVSIYPESALSKTLMTDAWSRLKSVSDRSILHGMFTFNVPYQTWYESIDGVEQSSFSNASSLNGKLILSSSGVTNEKVKLSSFRNPRYEPNRGHIYSVSIFLPSGGVGERSFGVFNKDSGVMFRLKSDGFLYGVRRTTIDGVPVDTEEQITIPEGVDLTKGNTFDIQFQWRGVGDYFFYINQELVLAQQNIGSLTNLSMSNPASPISFECIDQGSQVYIECGCVDVTTEGGINNGKTYGSISVNNDSGQIAGTGFNFPVLAVRNKVNFGTISNTRDVLALLATAYADQRSVLRVWATRDETAITLNDQVWSDFGDAHIEYIVSTLNSDGSPLVGSAITFDTSKAVLIFGARVDQDQSYATSALFEGRTEIHQTPGDIFVFTLHRENGQNVNVGVTYEFAEAI